MLKIVKVEKVKANNLVEMSPIEFIEFLEYAEISIIFQDVDSYYFMKEGFCYFCQHYNTYESYEQFRQKAKEILKAGFTNIELYESSKSFGIFDNQEDYLRFSNGGFFPNYDDYIDSKKGGFKLYEDYKEAKLIGINTYKEFIRFKNSKFYRNDYLSRLFQYDIFTQKHKIINQIAYKEFKEANPEWF
ncbi:MAG: hypothetical protein ACFFAN_03445 [Promethearchaeota archaeon]